MRIVLDTNILVRANPTVSPERLARELLMTILAGPHTLVLSEAILTEVERVMSYPRVQARWPLSNDVIAQYASFLRDVAAIAELPQGFPSVVSDPDDDLVLQTAIVGKADVLCSRDVAFDAASVQQVCHAHGIRIMGDIALLQELRRLANTQ